MLAARISLLVILCNCWIFAIADVNCYPVYPPVESINDCHAAAGLADDAFRVPGFPVPPVILRFGDCLVVIKPVAGPAGIVQVPDAAVSAYKSFWQDVRAAAAKILDMCFTRADPSLGPQLGEFATNTHQIYYYVVSMATATSDMPKHVPSWHFYGESTEYKVYDASSPSRPRNSMGTAHGVLNTHMVPGGLPGGNPAHGSNAHALAAPMHNLGPAPMDAHGRHQSTLTSTNDMGANPVYGKNYFLGPPENPTPGDNAIVPGNTPSSVYQAGNQMYPQNAHSVPVPPRAESLVYSAHVRPAPASGFESRFHPGNVRIASGNVQSASEDNAQPVHELRRVVSGNTLGESPPKRGRPEPGSSGPGLPNRRIRTGQYPYPNPRDPNPQTQTIAPTAR